MRTLGNGYIRRIDEGAPIQIGGVWKQIPRYQLVTNDAAAAVEAANFFNPMADVMPVGTQIDASLDLDGTPARKDYLVSSNAAGVVAVTAAAA